MLNDNFHHASAGFGREDNSLSLSKIRHKFMSPRTERRKLLALVLCAVTLVACSQPQDSQVSQGEKMAKEKNVVYFDVALHSYLDRPIFDVYLNGRDIGLAAGQPHHGAGGLMTGVAVPLGPQVITWRLDGPAGTPGNGNVVKAENQPVLSSPGQKKRYLGVHIYPDNSVEIIPEAFWPEKTERGLEINRQWELKHGKR